MSKVVDSIKTLSVTRCPRCLGDHADLPFRQFGFLPPVQGDESVIAHGWLTCPDRDEPILLEISAK